MMAAALFFACFPAFGYDFIVGVEDIEANCTVSARMVVMRGRDNDLHGDTQQQEESNDAISFQFEHIDGKYSFFRVIVKRAGQKLLQHAYPGILLCGGTFAVEAVTEVECNVTSIIEYPAISDQVPSDRSRE